MHSSTPIPFVDKRRVRRGFSLIELLVVVAIIVGLMGVLLPALAAAEEQARGTTCLLRLREIHRASKQFAYAHRNLLPKTTFDGVSGDGDSSDQSYSDQILPFMLPDAGDEDGNGALESHWYVNLDYFRCPSLKQIPMNENKAANGQQLDYGINNYGRLNNDSEECQRRYYKSMSNINVNDVRSTGVIYYADSWPKESPETLGGNTRNSGKLDWPLTATFDKAYLRHRWGYNAASLDGSARWFDGKKPNHVEWWIVRNFDQWWKDPDTKGTDTKYFEKVDEFKGELDALKDKYGN